MCSVLGAFSETPGRGTFTNSWVWLALGGVWIVKVCAISSGLTCCIGLPLTYMTFPTVPLTWAKKGLCTAPPVSYCLIVTVIVLYAGTLMLVLGQYVTHSGCEPPPGPPLPP